MTQTHGKVPQTTTSCHSAQSGRTLLETMAVLAIMGILSVTAVAAYNYAINKTRAVNLMQDARLLHASLLGIQTPGSAEWVDASSDTITNYPKQTMVDKVMKPYVKVAEVDEKVCHHLMLMAPKDNLTYFRPDWSQLTECEEANEIIFAFEGQGKPAECLAATECPDADNQICNENYQCADCEDLKVRNEEGTKCICDTAVAESCSTPEGDEWCCEKGNLCGWSAGECVPDDGCWYKYSQTTQPNLCQYKYSFETEDNACHYTYSQTTTDNMCSYTLDITQQDGLTVATMTPAKKCATGYYCNLRYGDENCSGTAANNATVIYGACNDVTTTVSACTYYEPKLTADPAHQCANGYYCNLRYGSKDCSATAANNSVDIWGACNDVTTTITACTYTTPKLQPVAGYECAEGYYCNLRYGNETCSETAANDATTIYGACNDVTTTVTACSYTTPAMTPEKSCPPNYYCNLRWGDQSCSTAKNNAETVYGRCLDVEKTGGSCPAEWGEADAGNE
ncbi:MAG: type II secretion system protein [Alphaproteobacteria bacterium]